MICPLLTKKDIDVARSSHSNNSSLSDLHSTRTTKQKRKCNNHHADTKTKPGFWITVPNGRLEPQTLPQSVSFQSDKQQTAALP